jgi:hypothetical protein
LAAVTSAFIPPPALAEVAVVHFLSLLELDEGELEPHPAATTSARLATPASAILCADFMLTLS